jgi:hypothetical protein
MEMTIINSSNENPRFFVDLIIIFVIFRGGEATLSNAPTLQQPASRTGGGTFRIPALTTDGLAFLHRVIDHRKKGLG